MRPFATCLLLLFAALALVPEADAATEAQIDRVSFTRRADGRGFVVRVHTTGRVGAFRVDHREGGPVELTLFQTRLAPSVRRDAAQGPVQAYRLLPDGDRVVIAFDVAGRPGLQVYPDRTTNDLLLALTTDDVSAPPAAMPPPVASGWGRAPVPRAAPSERTPRRTPARRAPSAHSPPGTNSSSTNSSSTNSSSTNSSTNSSSTNSSSTRPTESTSPADAGVAAPRAPAAAPAPAAPVAQERTRRRRPAASPAEASPAEASPAQATTAGASEMPVLTPLPPDAPPWPSPHPPERAAAAGYNWRLDKIVIDAGHGGSDHGASYFGVREKDVTLAIARRVGQLIEQMGVQVVYTRTDDRFVDLHERGRLANAAGGKLFLSIHANAAANPAARGTETYFLAPHRSESAREVMERENSVIRLESNPELYAELRQGGGILQALTMSAYQEESQMLAGLIESEFRRYRHSRGVKQAGFLVLWRASMPAVLIEVGFLSNREEAEFLGSPQGQERIAQSIARAVEQYKERYERALRIAAAG